MRFGTIMCSWQALFNKYNLTIFTSYIRSLIEIDFLVQVWACGCSWNWGRTTSLFREHYFVLIYSMLSKRKYFLIFLLTIKSWSRLKIVWLGETWFVFHLIDTNYGRIRLPFLPCSTSENDKISFNKI